MRVLGFSVAVVGLLSAVPALAQDTLTFDNGNILSGRIKRFERGEVTLDIPFADGDIYADWNRVVLIDSQRVFQFETSEGRRFLGRIQPETDPELGTRWWWSMAASPGRISAMTSWSSWKRLVSWRACSKSASVQA